MKYDDLHIALPAYNEATVIVEVLNSLKTSGFKNLIVVDDGSTDSTKSLASASGAVVLSHITNRGAGAASQTAIEYANKKGIQYLILMDADGQHHIEDIARLYDRICNSELDVVIGNRFGAPNNQIPVVRIWLNRIANSLTNFFCKNNYSDSQSGFRIMNRHAITSFNLKVDGYGFCSEMIIVGEKLGLSIGETPIKVSYTQYSMSKGQSTSNAVSTAFHFIWRVLFN